MMEVEQVYTEACGKWTGCDWPTMFGDTKLELNGVTSGQALQKVRETSGVDATDWREAVRWLRLIEADAETAEKSAHLAVEKAACGDLTGALRHARIAEELEARYHAVPVWRKLVTTIEAAILNR